MAGFTLTELMIVLFILALATTFVLTRVPTLQDNTTGHLLLSDIRYAARQAQITHTPHRIQIMSGQWTLTKLIESADGEPSPWQEKVWGRVKYHPTQAVLEEDYILGLIGADNTVPVSGEIIFMPDSSFTPFTLVIMHEQRWVYRIELKDGDFAMEAS